MDRDDYTQAVRDMVHHMEVGHKSEDILQRQNPRPVVKPTYRSTSHWTFMMLTPPWTRFQTRSAGRRAKFRTLVVNAALAAGLLALVVTSFVLGVARTSAEVLAVQRTFARVFGVVDTRDRSRPNLVHLQVQLLTLSTSSLALLRTAAHLFVAEFCTSSGGRVLVASDLFRMFAVREFLLDYLLALDGFQAVEQVTVHDEGLH